MIWALFTLVACQKPATVPDAPEGLAPGQLLLLHTNLWQSFVRPPSGPRLPALSCAGAAGMGRPGGAGGGQTTGPQGLSDSMPSDQILRVVPPGPTPAAWLAGLHKEKRFQAEPASRAGWPAQRLKTSNKLVYAKTFEKTVCGQTNNLGHIVRVLVCLHSKKTAMEQLSKEVGEQTE